jgi:phosphoribosylglycinamide formyltransferase 1
VARAAGVPDVLVARDTFGPAFDREAYTRRLVEALDDVDLHLVAMAGFMTVLAAPMFARSTRRVVNTHPSLLPAFPGAHAVREALAFGVKVTGCTVHVATETVDHGPILAQEAVPVLPGDTEASLHERIKDVERRLYPQTLKELMA